MSRYILAAKSGVHRVACLALYRALLRQSSQLGLVEKKARSLRHVIRYRFERNTIIQSPRQVITALELGYKSLETLKDAASGSTIIYARLSEYLNDIGVPAPRKNPPPLQAYNGPIVWARPNTPIVVHRPFPSLSGKRHIPKLANTNGIPHLRFKKPQSPFLSRVIRDKVKQREARFDTMAALREQVPLASEEDRWDDVLSEDHGIEEDDGDRRISWTNAIWKSHEEIKQLIQASHEKNTSLARKMYEIIEQEKVLAAKEGKSKEAVVLKESKIATELRLQESRGSVSIGAVTPLPLIRRLTM